MFWCSHNAVLLSYDFITGFLKTGTLVEQKLLIILEHMPEFVSFLEGVGGRRVSRSLVFCVVFCRSLCFFLGPCIVCLFPRPLYCLSFSSALVLSVLWSTAYYFSIIKLFLSCCFSIAIQ